MLKEFCDICKVEIGRKEVLNKVSMPSHSYNICNNCLEELVIHLENKSNSYKTENIRYSKDYRNEWKEIC